MIKIITEVFRMRSGSLIPLLYALREDGEVDRAVTDTLCDFVSHLFPPADSEIEALINLVREGKYVPDNPLLADFGVNDINVFVAPHAQKDGICISNENIPEYSVEEGQPQQFSISQFQAVLMSWRKFGQIIQERGGENIVGHKFETFVV